MSGLPVDPALVAAVAALDAKGAAARHAELAATVDALEEVVAAVAGRAEVWVDGGVRRGIDIVIARALGANAVLIGRPFLWALATGAEAGVARALELLEEECRLALALIGAPDLARIGRAHVR